MISRNPLRRIPMIRLTLLLALSSVLCAEDSISPLTEALPFTDTAPPLSEQLVIQNRILAKVREKTISVVDVMKKMDLFLQHYYPQVMYSPGARFQYYATQWKETLTQMVDQELILADAEQLELKVTDAEVRETLFERFGPNIMQTLDQLGLSYDEAREMIYTEMAVQRMMWYRVNSKALNRIGPQDIKNAYKKYCDEHPALEEWKYQVLSMRAPQENLSAALARKAADLLHQARTDLASVTEILKQETADKENPISISLSSELTADEKSIAASHKEVLKTLTPGAFSPPVAQVNRIDHSVVHRIFYLKDHSISKAPVFKKMSDQLKEELLQDAATQESVQYLNKLRLRYGYNEHLMLETLPADFQPFSLR